MYQKCIRSYSSIVTFFLFLFSLEVQKEKRIFWFSTKPKEVFRTFWDFFRGSIQKK